MEQGTGASSSRHSEQPSPVATTSNSQASGAQQGSAASSSRLSKLPPPVATTSITENTRDLSHRDDAFDEDLFRDLVPDGEGNVDNSSSTGLQDTATSSRNVPEGEDAASSSSVTSSVVHASRPPSSMHVRESSRSVASVQSDDVSGFTEVVAELPSVVSEKEAIDNLKKLNEHLAAMTIRDHVVSLQAIRGSRNCQFQKYEQETFKNYFYCFAGYGCQRRRTERSFQSQRSCHEKFSSGSSSSGDCRSSESGC